jgi:type IV secretory pathway VirB4 component
MNDEIIQLTERLLAYNQLFLKTYQRSREEGVEQDFQEIIKPFVDEVKVINDEWNNKMKIWLKEETHKHLHLKQIDNTTEHIVQLSIQCFFKKTSRSRFLNANRTVEYFLLEVLKEIKT